MTEKKYENDEDSDDFLRNMRSKSKITASKEIEDPKIENLTSIQNNRGLLFPKGIKKRRIEKKVVSTRISAEYVRILEAEAVRQDVYISDILAAIIEEAIERRMNQNSSASDSI